MNDCFFISFIATRFLLAFRKDKPDIGCEGKESFPTESKLYGISERSSGRGTGSDAESDISIDMKVKVNGRHPHSNVRQLTQIATRLDGHRRPK